VSPRYSCIEVALDADRVDAASGLLVGAGATGLETRDASTLVAGPTGRAVLIAWFDAPETATAASERLGQWLGPEKGSAVTVKAVEDPGWKEAWRDYFKPMRFGRRLWVAPPDRDPPEGATDTIIRLLPSGAFGTGTHESTSLMLELLDDLVRPGQGLRVLDVGCGSGILALAAVRLGAEQAFGIDVDPEAVEAARENAEKNGLDGPCRFAGTPLDEVDGTYDLVLANLSAPVLIAEKGKLADRVAADSGLLLWSGLLDTDVDEVGTPPGLTLVRDLRRNEWVAAAWGRPAKGDDR